jgi:hypothetical protein
VDGEVNAFPSVLCQVFWKVRPGGTERITSEPVFTVWTLSNEPDDENDRANERN